MRRNLAYGVARPAGPHISRLVRLAVLVALAVGFWLATARTVQFLLRANGVDV